MDIKKLDRTALKSYFVKNAIPTAGNFADLIDGIINQKEDGIVKLAGEPLSVQADGDDTSQKKAINFYKNFADLKPAWTLSLNPRVDPNSAATAKPGWSIGDADGNSKLFIDQTTGNVGIGTNTPAGKLEVNGAVVISNGNGFATKSGYMAAGSLTVGSINTNYGGGSNWNPNTAGLLLETLANTEIAVHDSGTRIASLMYYEGDATNRITIGRDMAWGAIGQVVLNGNVGIGTSPAYTLDVKAKVIKLGLEANGGGQLIVSNNANDNSIYLEAFNAAGDGHASQLLLTGRYGSNVPKLSLNADQTSISGNVGIGTASPGARLDVNAASGTAGGWYEAIRFSRSEHSAITHPGGGLLFGMHSDRHFYFADIAGGTFQKYVMQIQADTGNVGIGTTNPTSKLTVAGSIAGGETTSGWVLGKGAWGPDNWLRLTTTQSGSTYHDLAVRSFYAAGAQRYDLAEVTPVRAEDKLEQGDVVVIDRKSGLRVTRSTKPRDTAVYGIVSSYEQAAMIIGGGGPEAVTNASDKLPIALIGRVRAKACDESGPIGVGDLLTTSSKPGHMMKCDDPLKCIGAIVGKALESLTNGAGTISVLVSH